MWGAAGRAGHNDQQRGTDKTSIDAHADLSARSIRFEVASVLARRSANGLRWAVVTNDRPISIVIVHHALLREREVDWRRFMPPAGAVAVSTPAA
jgi:hypothetical protein